MLSKGGKFIYKWYIELLRLISFCSRTYWFVGSVLFYFTHSTSLVDEGCRQFLVLVSVMKEHTVADYDSTIPVVIMEAEHPKIVVISLNDIQAQVGLVQNAKNPLKFSVVTPYSILDEDMKKTAGKLSYI